MGNCKNCGNYSGQYPLCKNCYYKKNNENNQQTFYVYILGCNKNGDFSNFYVGQTNNTERREREHIQNVITANTRHYTGRFDFVKMIWREVVNTRAEALRLEAMLKSYTPEEKIEYMENNGELLVNLEVEDDF